MNKLMRRWASMLVFTIVMGTLFISLGEWQWHKHVARNRQNAVISANMARPVEKFPSLFANGHTISDAEQWQRVEVSGTYDAAHQFQAMQRSTGSSGGGGGVFGSFGGDNVSGTEAVTPLHTTTGQTVLVDRGLIPRQPGHNDTTTLPTPPSGQVTVQGYIRRDEHGKTSQVTPVNRQMLLVNAPALAAQLPYPVVDGYVQAISSTPADSAQLMMLAKPQTAGGPYLSYAVQWFMFTLIGVVGMVMIVRGDLRQQRRSERKQRIAAMRAQAAAHDAALARAGGASTVSESTGPAGAHAEPTPAAAGTGTAENAPTPSTDMDSPTPR